MSGKDNDRRRHFKRDKHGRRGHHNSYNNPKADNPWKRPGQNTPQIKLDKNGVPYDRPRWTAPILNTDPMPVVNCARCGEPIADLHSAMTDSRGGTVHFDCVINELSKREPLNEGEILSYIGGGRFGIVQFTNPPERAGKRTFTIKKILEWENTPARADWRGIIADHYSIT